MQHNTGAMLYITCIQLGVGVSPMDLAFIFLKESAIPTPTHSTSHKLLMITVQLYLNTSSFQGATMDYMDLVGDILGASWTVSERKEQVTMPTGE
jgi:hypothetical protein